MGCLSIAGLPSTLNLQYPFIHLGGESQCEGSVLPNAVPQLGLGSILLDWESSTLGHGASRKQIREPAYPSDVALGTTELIF